DLEGFRLKMNWGNDENWQHGTILADRIQHTRFDVGGLAKGLKTFMLRAVDVAGNESEGQAVIKAQFGDIDGQNVILEESLDPLWPGTKTNCTVDDGKLKADNVSVFWNSNPSAKHWSTDPTHKYWNPLFAEAVYEFEYIPSEDV